LTAQSTTVQYAPGSPCPKPTTTTSVTLPEIAASAALVWLFIDIDQGIFAKCGLNVNSSVMSPRLRCLRTSAATRVCGSPEADSTYKVALIYLQDIGLKASDVHFTYASTNPNIQASLQSGAAQAAVLTSPYAQVAMAHGAKTAFDFTKSSVKIPAEPIVADPSWVTSHTSVALNIMRAIMAGVWLANSKPDIARASLGKHLGIDASTPDGKVLC
jgi:hypothetical protein